jgi:hypothetical protein
MSQKILNAVTIMSMNADKLRKLDFNDVIEDFAREKARKKMF